MKKIRNSLSTATAPPATQATPDRFAEVVGTVREGDGVDPRDEAKRRRRTASGSPPGLGRQRRQQERFAGQVRLAIESALMSAATPILNALTVHAVVKQGGVLRVVLVPQNPAEPLDIPAATQAVARAASMLRREVASAITRKETPNLSFVVLPAGVEKVDDAG